MNYYPLLIMLLIVNAVQCSIIEHVSNKLTQIEYNTRRK